MDANFLPLLLSPTSDHRPCQAYADWMLAHGRTSSWEDTFHGARWELASARIFGQATYAMTLQHLARVADNDPSDFKFDYRLPSSRPVDAKFARYRSEGSNLIVPQPLPGIAYLLGEAATRELPARGDKACLMVFEVVGWIDGDDPAWGPCPFVPGKLWVPRHHLHELSTLR